MFSYLEDVQRVTSDVLVIGSGGAGCRAALAAHDCGARVVIATGSGLTGNASTFYSLTRFQGYAFGSNPEEVEQHYENILEAGQGMVDPELAQILAEEAPLRLQELLEWGFPFEQEGGRLTRIRPDFEPDSSEVAVAATRIDVREMSRAFIHLIRERAIDRLPHHVLVCLLRNGEQCMGGLFLNRQGRPVMVQAKATILATGGPNNVFIRHKNPPGLEGVGHVQALALGAELVNIEFYQVCFLMAGPIAGMNFSPNFFKTIPRLTNSLGAEFLSHYLPADISVERCIRERAQNTPFHSQGIPKYFDIAVVTEINAGRGSPGGGVWVDFTNAARQELRDKDPANFDWLLASGIDLSREAVEVLVAPHAFNGGVRINAQTETGVPGLFACGEIAGGPHGANRIGGNSIAGTQVFGTRAGHFAAKRAKQSTAALEVKKSQVQEQLSRLRQYSESRTGVEPGGVQQAIQEVMWNEMVVFKDAVSLTRLLKTLDAIGKDLLPRVEGNTPAKLRLAAALTAQLTISEIIGRVAQARKESRGPHYRTDYPKPDNDRFGQAIVVSQGQGGFKLSTPA
jgi:succinate dehydrogenase/fumarate reductase flavoprotein subunit